MISKKQQVNKENNLSPGRAAIIRGRKLDRKAEKRKKREGQREVKRRRIELKEERGNRQ